jgi:hypothetical protein
MDRMDLSRGIAQRIGGALATVRVRGKLSAAACSVALAASVWGGAAFAGERALSLGEVSTQAVASSESIDAETLRRAAERELGALDLSGVPAKRAAVVSLSLVRVEHARLPATGTGHATTSATGATNTTSSTTASTATTATTATTCVVSAVLRDKRKGTLFAIVEGRARVETSAKQKQLAEQQALEAAIRSALTRAALSLRG